MVREYNDILEAVRSVKSKQAVIFDMDGLMIDTEPVGKMLVKTSHEKFGYEITEEMFYHLIGTNEKTSKAWLNSDKELIYLSTVS